MAAPSSGSDQPLPKQLAQCQNELDRRRTEVVRYRNVASLFTESAYELVQTPEGDLTIRWLSDGFCTLAGHSQDELIDDDGSWHAIAHPADHECVHKHLSTLRSGQPSSAEYRIVTADDTVRWIEDRARPFSEGADDSIRIHGAIRDITERRADEERQKWQEEYRLRLYHITSTTGASFEDKVRRLLQLGVERLDVENGFLARVDPARNHHECVEVSAPHPTIAKGATTKLTQTYCQKVITSGEILAVHNAPEEGWSGDPAYEEYGWRCYLGAKVEVEDELYGTLCFADRASRDAPFSHEEKTFVELIVRWISHMIERQQHRSRLRREKLRFERLVDVVENYAIYMLDPDGHVASWNAGAGRITGYASEEIMGAPYSTFFTPEARDANQPQRILETAAREGQYQTEGERMRKDGTRFIAHVTVTPIYNDEGTLEGYTKVTRDITERKRQQEKLIKAKEEAEQMNRLKTAFLANMSHEIRTPLTSIIGFAEVLEKEVSSEKAEWATLIGQSGRRLLATLNSVLDLSMLESGEHSLDSELLDLAEEVRSKAQLMRPQAHQKGLSMDVDAPQQSIKVRLDPAAFDRILSNLLTNAIKFTEEGGIVVQVAQQTDTAVVRIQDTGVGIAEDFLPSLFDEFKQESTGRTRTHEGTGLGLTIAKQLTEAMDGSIEVDSQKGTGTTFTLSFPRAT